VGPASLREWRHHPPAERHRLLRRPVLGQVAGMLAHIRISTTPGSMLASTRQHTTMLQDAPELEDLSSSTRPRISMTSASLQLAMGCVAERAPEVLACCVHAGTSTNHLRIRWPWRSSTTSPMTLTARRPGQRRYGVRFRRSGQRRWCSWSFNAIASDLHPDCGLRSCHL